MAKTFGLLVALALTGCGRSGLSYTALDNVGSRVTRDELVRSWNVNGDPVELESLSAEPGCFVIIVKYKIVYDGAEVDSAGLIAAFGWAGALAQVAATAQHSEYQADQVAFALPVRAKHTYWVTATFTGEKFLPRIVESDAEGAHVRDIEPTGSMQEIRDCRANKVKPPP